MSFVNFAILATLGEMLGLRISTGVYHNKTFDIIQKDHPFVLVSGPHHHFMLPPDMVIWGVLGVLLAIAAKKK